MKHLTCAQDVFKMQTASLRIILASSFSGCFENAHGIVENEQRPHYQDALTMHIVFFGI